MGIYYETFTRKELQNIRDKAILVYYEMEKDIGSNEMLAKVYLDIATSCNALDAMLARVELIKER